MANLITLPTYYGNKDGFIEELKEERRGFIKVETKDEIAAFAKIWRSSKLDSPLIIPSPKDKLWQMASKSLTQSLTQKFNEISNNSIVHLKACFFDPVQPEKLRQKSFSTRFIPVSSMDELETSTSLLLEIVRRALSSESDPFQIWSATFFLDVISDVSGFDLIVN